MLVAAILDQEMINVGKQLVDGAARAQKAVHIVGRIGAVQRKGA